MIKFLKVECKKNIITDDETMITKEFYLLTPSIEYNTFIIDKNHVLKFKKSDSQQSILDEFFATDDYETFINNYGFLVNFADDYNKKENRKYLKVFKTDIDKIKKRILIEYELLKYLFNGFDEYKNFTNNDYLIIIKSILELFSNCCVSLNEFNYSRSLIMELNLDSKMIFSENDNKIVLDNLYNAYTKDIDKFTEEQQLFIKFFFYSCFMIKELDTSLFIGERLAYFDENELISINDINDNFKEKVKKIVQLITAHEINYHSSYVSSNISLENNINETKKYENLISVMYDCLLNQAKINSLRRVCENEKCNNVFYLTKVGQNKKCCCEACRVSKNQRNYQARKRNEKNK